MTDTTDTVIRQLLDSNPLREPVLRSMAHALRLPAGGHGLDAGAGIGLQVPLLAEATGPAGHITCLDLSSDLLWVAEERTRGTVWAEMTTTTALAQDHGASLTPVVQILSIRPDRVVNPMYFRG